MPEFAKRELDTRGMKTSIIQADPKNPYHFPDLDALDNAEVLLVSVRRRPLPEAELTKVRDFLKAGKGLVGIRTASHAFAAPLGKQPDPALNAVARFRHRNPGCQI